MKRLLWTPAQDVELQTLFATMTAREVAAKLGVTVSAAENRLRRLRGALSPERKGAQSFTQEKPVSPLQEDGHQGVRLEPPGEAGLPESVARAPAVHTRASNYLVVSDTQLPFEHGNALRFCESVRREFNIPRDNVLHVGDELDQLNGSRFPKDPDGELTPNQEIKLARERLAPWFAAYPRMRLAISNHGMRWVKKAFHAEIPSQLMRGYKELLGAPEGWDWRERWTIDAVRQPFVLEHGHEGAQGMYAYRQKALDNGVSTVHGHLHAHAGIAHIRTNMLAIWGMCVGCLIDCESFAFRYDKGSRFKPVLAVGVVIDGGRIPLLVPYG